MQTKDCEIKTFGVGFNMAGFSPDMDPHSAPCIEEAKACLVESIQHFLDDEGDPEAVEPWDSRKDVRTRIAHFEDAINVVKTWMKPGTVFANGWAFWIREY